MLLEIKTLPRQNPTGRGMVPRVCVLQCDVCQTKYERPYSHVQLDVKIHRCSQKCMYGSRSTDGLGGHGAEIVELSCLVCDKKMKLRKIGNERKWGKCCSRKCYGQYRSEHPELYVDNTNMMHTPESAAKISTRALERSSQPDYVHSQTGLKRSEETRELLRQRKVENPLIGEKNGMWGREQTEEAKEKMSDAVTKRILAGNFKPYGTCNIKGYYTSTRDCNERFYRSSWELALMKWLDSNQDVKSWEYESVRIPYYYDSHKRWYVPDFIITFQDGHREMWEVKPKEFIDTEKNVLKTLAAKEYCQQVGIQQFKLMTGTELRQLLIIR